MIKIQQIVVRYTTDNFTSNKFICLPVTPNFTFEFHIPQNVNVLNSVKFEEI